MGLLCQKHVMVSSNWVKHLFCKPLQNTLLHSVKAWHTLFKRRAKPIHLFKQQSKRWKQEVWPQDKLYQSKNLSCMPIIAIGRNDQKAIDYCKKLIYVCKQKPRVRMKQHFKRNFGLLAKISLANKKFRFWFSRQKLDLR